MSYSNVGSEALPWFGLPWRVIDIFFAMPGKLLLLSISTAAANT